jgi:hypothetical protein
MKTHKYITTTQPHPIYDWRAWLELLNKATPRKSLEKWPKIVENGQTETHAHRNYGNFLPKESNCFEL